MCRLLGVTRQAYYQHFWSIQDKSIEEHLIVSKVREIRQTHKRMGGRKLHEKLEPFLLDNQIKMGRDGLFNVLANNNLLVKKRRTRVYTTNSSHWLRKYPNKIKELKIERRNQVWVSDITYWKNNGKNYYISFVTDMFSHKIVGYQIAKNLSAVESIKALKMAISGFKQEPDNHFKLIHHSDRGIQYCSKDYVDLLKSNGIAISMTENGDPLENPVAERINGIIKEEYLDGHEINTLKEAKELLDWAVFVYNEDRPHSSLNMKTPTEVHHRNLKTKRLWKNYYKQKSNIVNPKQDKTVDVNLN
jgi:transposase InsO family protein